MKTAQDVMKDLGLSGYGDALERLQRIEVEHTKLIGLLSNLATFGTPTERHTAQRVLKLAGVAA
jgi:hypothetical protein